MGIEDQKVYIVAALLMCVCENPKFWYESNMDI